MRPRHAGRRAGPGPSWRFVFVTASLVGTMLIAAAAAWGIHGALEEHRESVARSLDEYVRYAARTFGEQLIHTSAELRLRLMAPVLGTPAAGPGGGMPLDAFAERAAAVFRDEGMAEDPLRGFFRLDLATGAWETAGSAAQPEVAAPLVAAVRRRLPVLARAEEPALAHLEVGGEALSVTYARQRTAAGEPVAVLGTVSSRRAWTRIAAARILRRLPLLPPSFISPEWRYDRDVARNDSVVSIEVADNRGYPVFRSSPVFESRVRGEFVFNTNPGGFTVRSALHPALVERITADHRHDERRRLLVVLPVLIIVLAASVIVNLLHERELARARERFLASVSHELRTPLAQIRMFAETLLLGRERSEAERMRWTGVIGRESRRLGDLVENILLFSHLEGPGVRLAREPTDLGELAEDVVSAYEPMAAARRVRVETVAEPGVAASVDPRTLRQVLVNLLDNAVKYGPRDGTVTVRVARAGEGRAELAVEDRGPGVPAQERGRIWEPFVRLTESGGTAGGSGLGLAVVRGLVEEHGGEARVEDAPGGGARFVVSLPALPPAGAPAAAPGAPGAALVS
ncbi:MAG TPA: HAMP domain-containing sensor histidine kinase [Longimicrobiaceae bacterium]